MINSTKQAKKSALIIAIDFRKAFDSINHSFIDTCLKTLNFGESFRKWVQLFFSDRETYLMMNQRSLHINKETEALVHSFYDGGVGHPTFR